MLEHQEKVSQSRPDCLCTSLNGSHDKNCKKSKSKLNLISPKADGGGGGNLPSSLVQSRLVALLNSSSHKASVAAAQNAANGPSAATSLLLTTAPTPTTPVTTQQMANNGAPFILNLSQLQGSNGLIILSSQTPAPISIINRQAAAAAQSAAVMDSEAADTPTESQSRLNAEGLVAPPGQNSTSSPSSSSFLNHNSASFLTVKEEASDKTGGDLFTPQQDVVMDFNKTATECSSAENNFPPSHNGSSTTSHEKPADINFVSMLNLKNEAQSLMDPDFALSQDEIQKTLQANMPSGGKDFSSNQTSSMESLDALRSSMVSPQSTDLNLDAFDILDLPDFENLSTDVSMPCTSVANNNPATTCTSTTTINCASCLSSHKSTPQPTPTRVETRMGIANITDFSPDWSYPEVSTQSWNLIG